METYTQMMENSLKIPTSVAWPSDITQTDSGTVARTKSASAACFIHTTCMCMERAGLDVSERD